VVADKVGSSVVKMHEKEMAVIQYFFIAIVPQAV